MSRLSESCLEYVKCPSCKAICLPTPGGYVTCPHGHTKLIGVPRDVLSMHVLHFTPEAQIAGRLAGPGGDHDVWRVPGSHVAWVRARTASKPTAMTRMDLTLAKIGGRPYWFRRLQHFEVCEVSWLTTPSDAQASGRPGGSGE